ncbi:hypothetical protein LX87_00015 [Larkinella arboricola]|uniref:Outer membrane protein with beta-barrel domain n=1 Tax=Larkinella arboricola TaxID=643671 RepID=A0A327X588_LARAB|nr:anti-sigma factor [Larkinella arboricola]RAK01901.1 hypothetical protein LX87_00015 [Larkinella arboricola]
MSLPNEEQFNEEWRKVFEDAAESPSDGLWDSIARQLDEEETTPVLPLWRRATPWVYGVAAAVITLLVGWWATQSIDNAGLNHPTVGHTTRPANSSKAGEQLAKQQQNRVPANPQTIPDEARTGSELAQNREETLAANRPANAEKNTSATPEREPSQTAGTRDRLSTDRSFLARKSERTPTAEQPVFAGSSRRANRVPDAARVNSDAPSEQAPGSLQNTDLAADTRLAYEASYINSKSALSKKPAPISRIIWYRAPETAIEPQEKGHSRKEYWAALTATPMSFNPMASVQSNLNQAYVALNGAQQSSRQYSPSSLQNQAQVSMAWQASSGVKLSKHWSVEAGIQYLNGRSQAQNNAVVTNAFTNQTENLLVNAVRSSNPSLPQLAMDMPNNSYVSPTLVDKSNGNPLYLAVIPSNDVVSNNFQYIQVPVQIGYHILPEHKFSYSVLGGLMANVFLKNTINEALEVNPSDQVYRPTALAGTAGLRVNYHPTHHWSGSLTGSYQQSLQSGTNPDAQLQIRPQAIGIGFGLNYHF